MTDKRRMSGPLEITSPILTFDDKGAWRQHVRTVFDLVEDHCEIKTDISCGFHVHLSPADREWDLAELQNISIAILHFEQAMFDVLPEERRPRFGLKPNSRARYLKKITPDER
jgi:hypothetical protein